MIMNPLKEHYRKNGYDYDLVKRNEHVAMFIQRDKGRQVAFEVGYIHRDKGGTIAGNVIPAGERLWSNEMVGQIAWIRMDQESADTLFNELTTNAQEKAARKEAVHQAIVDGDDEEGPGDEGVEAGEQEEATSEEGTIKQGLVESSPGDLGDR